MKEILHESKDFYTKMLTRMLTKMLMDMVKCALVEFFCWRFYIL